MLGWKSAMSRTLTVVTAKYRDWVEQEKIKCFEKEQRVSRTIMRRDLGLKIVPVQQIVGSVGRCHDFDKQFRLKRGLPLDRLKHIKRVMLSGKILPPVKLYKIEEEYYVLDGNHRVAAAKEIGQLYIDAYVIEYFHPINGKTAS